MKHITLILLVLFSLHASIAQSNKTEYIKERGFEGVIFPKEYETFNVNRFTPTREQIQMVEAELKRQLPELTKNWIKGHDQYPHIYKNLHKYKRQYFGYLDSNGDEIIYINCFWAKEDFGNWVKNEIAVLDGGSYFWQIKLNLKTLKLFDLMINGIA